MCDYEAGSDEPMWTGHTWKPYYFYYNKGAGDFAEYGAKEITREEYIKFYLENEHKDILQGILNNQKETLNK